ncbi:MAG: hypothetical protein WC028_28395 [Candidatus Obscuribacterales bacterium]|jgi:hypothetical protein
MAVSKKQSNENWLERAKEHLLRLCREAEEFSDEYDVHPTNHSVEVAFEVLESFQTASSPKIALTVNNEISLGWNNHGEEFHAYVKPNGTVEYFHNSEVVGRPCFARDLSHAPV